MSDAVQEMGTARYLQSVLKHIATRAAMASAYESWEDGYSRVSTRKAWLDTEHEPWHRRVTVAELQKLPIEDLRMLGFVGWDDKLTCIPLWAFNYIADGETLTCIDGKTAVKGTDDIDLDVRFGCIAYGFATR